MTGRGAANAPIRKRKSISKSKRANVLFPVGRLHRYLKERTHKYRIGVGAAVYTASVIEYLAAEVLELAGNVALDSHRNRITPRHIFIAVSNDQELHDFLSHVTIPSGGVMPRILPQLITSKKALPSLSLSMLAKSKLPPPATPAKKPVAKRARRGKKAAVTTPTTNAGNISKGTGATPLKMRAKGITTINTTLSTTPTVLSEKKLFLGQMLTVVQQDITTIVADAIVHPTNANFLMLGEIGQALEKAGGKKLVQEIADVSKKTGNLAPCDVAVSSSFNLPSKWVIHVNGPSHGDVNAYDKLETSVKNCLVLADLKNYKSIAFPSIGSGRAGFPKQQAAQTIIKSICNYFVNVMSSSLKQIYFVLYDMESIGAYTSELAKIDG